ncbi:Hint domain-containing protein [Maritimibacter sp. UBA3975]|uniref:Hint domain-containing protein n=1 Tax=Maritimibacter sp. UBA3975 TaxID=1946833 RepID=UPI000C097485|nr:Hint domain-containing protein [Maritimibacter sp. UBA3975]MAM63804.1 hypothetical protein [Maritimibacter sp.]|tara:strand:- start:7490 stop:8605 length:1116 start_codon:yes stop_codon:yes gene_type:complete
MPFLAIYSISDTTHSGPNPWPPGANSNPSSAGNTIITLNPGAGFQVVEVTDLDTTLDDDPTFDDSSSEQYLTNPTTINGTNYPAGQTIENEYAYVIRPVGSSDPADNITIYVLDEGGATPSIGFVSSQELVAGQNYQVVGTSTDEPSTPYTEIFACFGPGTLIETPEGPRRVDDLRPGDKVVTLDDGAQPILWIGSREVQLEGVLNAQTPLNFPKDSLAPGYPTTDLVLSPLHRVLVSSHKNDHVTGGEEVFAPARALAKRPGVRYMRGRSSITYFSILLPRHAVLFANGVPSESFYPSPYSLSILKPSERLAILAHVPHLSADVAHSYGPLARPDLTAPQGRRLKRKRPIYEGPLFGAWAAQQAGLSVTS